MDYCASALLFDSASPTQVAFRPDSTSIISFFFFYLSPFPLFFFCFFSSWICRRSRVACKLGLRLWDPKLSFCLPWCAPPVVVWECFQSRSCGGRSCSAHVLLDCRAASAPDYFEADDGPGSAFRLSRP